MGKKKPHFKKKKVSSEAQTHVAGVRKPYEDIIKENHKFEAYYKIQNICPEDEWGEMMNYLRQSLPTTFRMTSLRSEVTAMVHIFEKQLVRDAELAGRSDDMDSIRAFPLPWYPDNLGWQLNLTRKDIRRSEAYFRLHNFLISETESGNINRQEAVSMIPPLALGVEPHHKVLDLCAAPGSKTAQIIELLHKGASGSPKGFVVANDLDNKRCYMLVHQGKRLQSSAFVVTNHDASLYPNVYTLNNGIKTKTTFDRVLCDVPCSGDGTMRKNIDLWKKWSPANALHLHEVQFGILKRGLELLAVGGRLVYSTCSFNPIENEAVIHRMLKITKGSIELMDIDVQHLKHSPGVSYWKPCSRDLLSYNSITEVHKMWQGVVKDYMFPPSPDEATNFNLQKCMRILPHQQDTGGFFIALLVKTNPLPWETDVPVEMSTPSSTLAGTVAGPRGNKPSPRKNPRLFGYKEDPYVFLDEKDEIWPDIRKFYSFDDGLDCTLFLKRCTEGKIRNIYLTTPFVKDFVQANEGRIKIINVGVKALARVDKKWTSCDFRLSQEGLPALLPYIKGRTIEASAEDIKVLLQNDDQALPPVVESFSENLRAQLELMEKGSLVIMVNNLNETVGPKFSFELVGWKGATSLRAYVQKNERMHYLRLVGGDVSKFEKNKFKEKDNITADQCAKPEDEVIVEDSSSVVT